MSRSLAFFQCMRGHTLAELVAVLSLLAIGTASLAPTARTYRDRIAVLSARESIAGLLSEARAAALAHGEGSVVIKPTPWRAWSATGDSTLRSVALESNWGVEVVLGAGRDSVAIRYGPLGLGRFASATLIFRRGAASRRLVVSGYGRVRRD